MLAQPGLDALPVVGVRARVQDERLLARLHRAQADAALAGEADRGCLHPPEGFRGEALAHFADLLAELQQLLVCVVGLLQLLQLLQLLRLLPSGHVKLDLVDHEALKQLKFGDT